MKLESMVSHWIMTHDISQKQGGDTAVANHCLTSGIIHVSEPANRGPTRHCYVSKHGNEIENTYRLVDVVPIQMHIRRGLRISHCQV